MPPPYNAQYHKKFSDKVGDNQRIKNVIKRILLNPKHNSTFLKGDLLRGKRHIWVGKPDRIIFAICEECKQLNHQKYNKCSDCSGKTSHDIIFFDFIKGHRY